MKATLDTKPVHIKRQQLHNFCPTIFNRTSKCVSRLDTEKKTTEN